MIALDRALLEAMPLPDHEDDVDKDARGCVLAVGGSLEVPGGILLASVAALRAGAGKLQIGTCRTLAPTLGLMVPEALVVALPETPAGGIDPSAIELLGDRIERCDAVVIGPGMSDAPAVAELTRRLLANDGHAAILLDAAALAGVEAAADRIRARGGNVVLTPHHGEMAGLLGIDRARVAANPEAIAADVAERFQCVVALKCNETVVATPSGDVFRYGGGGIGLATSGSGDTLAGIIAGLLARGCDARQATLWGVYLHGEAGRRLARSHGRIGFLARELLTEVPRVMGTFEA